MEKEKFKKSTSRLKSESRSRARLGLKLKLKFIPAFFLYTFVSAFVSFHEINITSHGIHISNLNVANSEDPDQTSSQTSTPIRSERYRRELRTNYLAQQYFNNPELFIQHRLTVGGDVAALGVYRKFEQGQISASEARRNISSSLGLRVGVDFGVGSLDLNASRSRDSDSTSYSVGGDAALGVLGFNVNLGGDYSRSNPIEDPRVQFLSEVHQYIARNPSEILDLARDVSERQYRHNEFQRISGISGQNLLEVRNSELVDGDTNVSDGRPRMTVDVDGTLHYSDGTTSVSTNPIVIQNLAEVEASSGVIGLGLTDSDANASTGAIETAHPELTIPFEILQFSKLTDERLRELQTGQVSIEEHLSEIGQDVDEVKRKILASLDFGVRADESEGEEGGFSNFEIELAIQVMFPSPGNQSQQIKRARAFVESEINDIDRQLSSSDSTSFSFGMNLGQNLSPDEREALEEKKRRWEQRGRNIQTRELELTIARGRVAFQNITSVLELVGFEEASTISAFGQSSLDVVASIGDIAINGLSFVNVGGLVNGVSGLLAAFSNTPSADEIILGKLDEVLDNQVKIMKAIDEVHQIVYRTEQKVDYLNEKMDGLIGMLEEVYLSLSHFLNAHHEFVQAEFDQLKEGQRVLHAQLRENYREMLNQNSLAILIAQESALRETFASVAGIHDLFENRIGSPIQQQLMSCKNKSNFNECTQTAQTTMRDIQILLGSIAFHMTDTLMREEIFFSPMSFSDFSQLSEEAILTSMGESVEKRTGLFRPIGEWLNQHVGEGRVLPSTMTITVSSSEREDASGEDASGENTAGPDGTQQAQQDATETDGTAVADGTDAADDDVTASANTNEVEVPRRLVNVRALDEVGNLEYLPTLFEEYIALAMHLPTHSGDSSTNRDENMDEICTVASRVRTVPSEMRKNVRLAFDVYLVYLRQIKAHYDQLIAEAETNFKADLNHKIDGRFLFASDLEIEEFTRNLSDSELESIALHISGAHEVVHTWYTTRKCLRWNYRTRRVPEYRCLERREFNCDSLNHCHGRCPLMEKIFLDDNDIQNSSSNLFAHDICDSECVRAERTGTYRSVRERTTCAEYEKISTGTIYTPKRSLLTQKIKDVRDSSFAYLREKFQNQAAYHSTLRSGSVPLSDLSRNLSLSKLVLDTILRAGYGSQNLDSERPFQAIRQVLVSVPYGHGGAGFGATQFLQSNRNESEPDGDETNANQYNLHSQYKRVILVESDFNQFSEAQGGLQKFMDWIDWVRAGEEGFGIPTQIPIPSNEVLEEFEQTERLLGLGNPTQISSLFQFASNYEDIRPRSDQCVRTFNL